MVLLRYIIFKQKKRRKIAEKNLKYFRFNFAGQREAAKHYIPLKKP